MRIGFAVPALVGASLWGQSPENVLVVVNRNSELSGRIARYYVQKRLIPPQNVCRIAASTEETIQRREYQNVEAGVRACLEARPKTPRIDYIATTQGVPLRIDGTIGREATAASVDSELTLLGKKMKGEKIAVEGPVNNPFYHQKHSVFRSDAFGIYLVTRLAAYRWETLKRMIDDALEAKNKGLFVVDLTEDESNSGNGWLLDAAILLPEKRVLLDRTKAVVKDARDVIGYAAWGSNDTNRRDRFLGFRWLPGSIATEYVSSNGRTFQPPPGNWTIGPWKNPEAYWHGSPQTLTADYLEEGATAASGHVLEPFLQFAPRPDLVLPAYYSGRTVAESFYLGIRALSWMNIVVGDPLCRIGPP
jgi:uncharacterized protein (TIGR03790 family)